MAAAARLEPHALAPEAELAAFLEGRDADGGVVSFTGVMRAMARDGRPLTRLHLDWYPGMTEVSLQAIAEAAADRFPVSDVVVVHRCGDVAPGEAIVFAAAAAPHRRDAFRAVDYLMDRLKTDAAFWKREDGPDGSRWIEPLASDHTDAARWSD